MRRTLSALSLSLLAALPAAAQSAPDGPVRSGPVRSGPAPYRIEGDAIPQSLTGAAGDPARGRAIVANRSIGLCLLCHSGPVPEERFQGTMAPSLAGAGARWTVGQLRLRLVDPAHLNADTIMPAYYRTEGLNRVGRNFAGKTILNAGQVEDVVAYLATLKERP